MKSIIKSEKSQEYYKNTFYSILKQFQMKKLKTSLISLICNMLLHNYSVRHLI